MKKQELIYMTAFLLFVAFLGWDHQQLLKSRVLAQDAPKPSVVDFVTPPPKERPLTRFITVKVSHYWPALGGTNCLTFQNGKCISRMANGEPWETHAGVAIACPRELKFGTRIRIGERIWTCEDRGSAIVTYGTDKYWVDQLSPVSLYNYGEEVEAEMYLD
jgi:hypothetical protein